MRAFDGLITNGRNLLVATCSDYAGVFPHRRLSIFPWTSLFWCPAEIMIDLTQLIIIPDTAHVVLDFLRRRARRFTNL